MDGIESRTYRSTRRRPPAKNMTINLSKVDFRSLGIISFLEASFTVLYSSRNFNFTRLALNVKFCTIM